MWLVSTVQLVHVGGDIQSHCTQHTDTQHTRIGRIFNTFLWELEIYILRRQALDHACVVKPGHLYHVWQGLRLSLNWPLGSLSL